MDNRFRLYQRQLERQFSTDHHGNVIYFPWGRFGSGYIVPPSVDKANIIQRKLQSSMRVMPLVAILLPLSYIAPTHWGKNGLIFLILFGGALLIFHTMQSYLDTKRMIQGYIKSEEKYKTSSAQRAADYAEVYTESQIKLHLAGGVFLFLLGIFMCRIGDVFTHILGVLLITLVVIAGPMLIQALRIKSKDVNKSKPKE